MYESESIDNIESIESMAWNVRNKSQMDDLVECLCKIHSDLCDTCANASDYFAIKMVSIIGANFLNVLLNGYFVFVKIFKDRTPQKLDRLNLAAVTYCLLESVMIILGMTIACNSCHRIGEEVMLH